MFNVSPIKSTTKFSHSSAATSTSPASTRGHSATLMKPVSPDWLHNSSHVKGAKGASSLIHVFTASTSVLPLAFPLRWMYQRKSFHVSKNATSRAVLVFNSSKLHVTVSTRRCSLLISQRSKCPSSSSISAVKPSQENML